MNNHETTLPPSYQQVFEESDDENYEDISVDVCFKSKQILSDDEKDSTFKNAVPKIFKDTLLNCIITKF